MKTPTKGERRRGSSGINGKRLRSPPAFRWREKNCRGKKGVGHSKKNPSFGLEAVI